MRERKLSKNQLAKEMHTSRTQIDRLLDPEAELYALRVTDAAAARMSESGTDATVFADPRIEPADPE